LHHILKGITDRSRWRNNTLLDSVTRLTATFNTAWHRGARALVALYWGIACIITWRRGEAGAGPAGQQTLPGLASFLASYAATNVRLSRDYIPSYMPSASRSLGRKELRGVLRLCWSESGAPHTLPPSPELLELLLVEGQPRETPEPRADQVSPLVDLAREV